jgi:nucleotide-binding universal stress UspA family protein
VARKGRYLVAVDFSRDSRRALRVARKLARQTGALLVLAHVRPLSDVRAAVVEERGDLLGRKAGSLAPGIDAHYAGRLAAWARKTDRVLVLRGAPDVALRREAARGYDLLVMGSRGRGPVSAALLGSTVQRTLTRSLIPVLVAPHARSAARPGRSASTR